MKKRERSVIQLLYYYFHIENLRNFSMFEFHNPIQTQPSYPIVPKNKFKTTIISINFKSAFRVTQHPLNCPERITKFTSRRVEAPLTAIQLPHPPPHTHTQFKSYGGIPGSRINARIARILQCNTPILPYRPSATGRVNNLRGVEDIRRRRWLRSLVETMRDLHVHDVCQG